MFHASKNDDINTIDAWGPTANIETLRFRAATLAKIRDFFAKRQVLEVDTPLLCHATVTDPHLHSLSVRAQSSTQYLQTSPEYAMKRLLAAGSGSIYQICKAFRADESGRLHQPEFTMLEWYRVGFDHHALMDEMEDLLQTILNCSSAIRLTYADVFQKYLGIDPHRADTHVLQRTASDYDIHITGNQLQRDDWLQLLLVHCIEPQLDKQQSPIFIYDFPASQAALAKIRQEANIAVAERFEVYMQGIELANGYHELSDADEQARRFSADLEKRQRLGFPQVPIDHYLLAALKHGFPASAGVALGIDRLMMIAAQKQQLAEVVAFTSEHV